MNTWTQNEDPNIVQYLLSNYDNIIMLKVRGTLFELLDNFDETKYITSAYATYAQQHAQLSFYT